MAVFMQNQRSKQNRNKGQALTVFRLLALLFGVISSWFLFVYLFETPYQAVARWDGSLRFAKSSGGYIVAETVARPSSRIRQNDVMLRFRPIFSCCPEEQDIRHIAQLLLEEQSLNKIVSTSVSNNISPDNAAFINSFVDSAEWYTAIRNRRTEEEARRMERLAPLLQRNQARSLDSTSQTALHEKTEAKQAKLLTELTTVQLSPSKILALHKEIIEVNASTTRLAKDREITELRSVEDTQRAEKLEQEYIEEDYAQANYTTRVREELLERNDLTLDDLRLGEILSPENGLLINMLVKSNDVVARGDTLFILSPPDATLFIDVVADQDFYNSVKEIAERASTIQLLVRQTEGVTIARTISVKLVSERKRGDDWAIRFAVTQPEDLVENHGKFFSRRETPLEVGVRKVSVGNNFAPVLELFRDVIQDLAR